MTDANTNDVTSLDEVMAMLKAKIDAAAVVTQSKVLPGARAKVMVPLMEANALLASASEVLERSGMGKKLGFVKTGKGLQPIASKTEDSTPVKDD